MNLSIGDKVLLRRRPAGHNVPGTVEGLAQDPVKGLVALVRIRADKVVAIKVSRLEKA